MSLQQKKQSDSEHVNNNTLNGSFMNLRNQRLKREKSLSIINNKH